MIKLIASDIDGTLLPEGTPVLNPDYYTVLRELNKQGVQFAAASGRAYKSIEYLFHELKDEIYFIAVNGAQIIYQGKELRAVSFEQELYREIIQYVRSRKNRFVIVSTSDSSYTDYHDEAFLRQLNEGYHDYTEQVEDMLQITEPILKVAMNVSEDAVLEVAPAQAVFGDRVHIMAAGDHWVDFVCPGADKGTAVQELQKLLKIRPEETAAFGDNDNDIGMLRASDKSFAVAGARDSVKEVASVVLPKEKDAVLKELRRILG